MNFKKSASKKVSLAIAFALASSCLSIFTFSQKAHAYGYSLPNGLGGRIITLMMDLLVIHYLMD